MLKQPSAGPALAARAHEIMGHQIQNLARLVDDLLDISRLSQGRIQLRMEPTDASTVVRQAVEALRPQVEARGQDLLLSLPSAAVELEADPLRLEQTLANLPTTRPP